MTKILRTISRLMLSLLLVATALDGIVAKSAGPGWFFLALLANVEATDLGNRYLEARFGR